MTSPLSSELRPIDLKEIMGQDHLTGPEGFLTKTIASKKPLSILLWGPPGCGKTSIARLFAKAFDYPFYTLSGASDSVSDLKKVIKEHESSPLFGRSLMLFVDEIHRFNKAQQDAFLPLVEKGTVVLIGATAENPSFYLNPALLSRLRVLPLKPLDDNALEKLIERYEKAKGSLELSEKEKNFIVKEAQGDGRYLFNLIENYVLGKDFSHVQKRAPLYDRSGDGHYNLISALHKSVRGSDPEASLYWLARMLEGGEDPLFLARRIIRMASEDIGLADPNALNLAISAREAYQTLGSPEGELALAEAVVYLALSPKSNRIYSAFKAMKTLAKETGHMPPPKIILNAPTKLMKQEGYGEGYQYDHDLETGFSGQNYFPDGIERTETYLPVERGFERELLKRIDYFNKLRKRH
ncbi:MAG: replication-associated recombination protein A [Chlamydiia bacterium]|nr:replication-associated recombination protein A [Chlamydiia bacterium]